MGPAVHLTSTWKTNALGVLKPKVVSRLSSQISGGRPGNSRKFVDAIALALLFCLLLYHTDGAFR